MLQIWEYSAAAHWAGHRLDRGGACSSGEKYKEYDSSEWYECPRAAIAVLKVTLARKLHQGPLTVELRYVRLRVLVALEWIGNLGLESGIAVIM